MMARQAERRHGPAFERNWSGAALFSYGFRPFFLGGAAFAALAIGLWLFEWLGAVTVVRQLAPVDWHMHEMIFGYPAAVIAGFLFTAVPNWTRRLPVSGRPLIALFSLWVVGRVVLLVPETVPYVVVAGIEAMFLPTLAAVIGREIVAGRSWRNLKVLVPVSVFACANIWFHVTLALGHAPDMAVRFGLAAVLILVTLIGGRIVPSFTRNWLAAERPVGRMPVPFGRLDIAVTGITVAALLLWVGELGVSSTVLALAAFGQSIRLTRWAGERTLSNPLLFVLHFFYAFLPVGLALLAAEGLTGDPTTRIAGLHVLGIGGIGGMTLAVMTRASLGHTGRALSSSPMMNLAFALIPAAVLFRLIAVFLPQAGWTLHGAVAAWVLAFGLFTLRIGPWLLSPRRKKPA
jgi:uncharacterized protein involved in response to NO